MSIITILDAAPKMLTKQFSLVDGAVVKNDYDKCYKYEYKFADCKNINDLHELLQWLATEPTMCIIRGELKDPTNTDKVVRQKTSREAPFRENPNGVGFFMCDFDKIEVPAWLPTDLDCYLEFLVSSLPEYLHDVSYVYQWSSQAGMDGWKTLRCHIWFWHEEPRTDTEMGLWCKFINNPRQVVKPLPEEKVVDDCTMRTVQPNYTASPIFNPGVTDPLAGCRVGLVPKNKDAAFIPVIAPAQSRMTSTGQYVAAPAPKGLLTKFDVRLEAIGPDYHMPITQAVASWISLTGPRSDLTRLKDRLKARIIDAPGDGSAGRAHYLSDEYLDAQIKGCPFAHKIDGPDRMPETQNERIRYKLSNKKTI